MLRQFFAYYRPHRRLFALDFGCAIVSGLLEQGFPMAIRAFVDQLLPGPDWNVILLASAALLGVYLINTGLTAVVVYWGHLLGINIETEMRRRAFDHLHKLSFSSFDNNKTGTLITYVTKDLEDVGEVAHHGSKDLSIAVMTFVGAFALMFTINARLALLTAIITPVVTVLSTRYGSRMRHNFRALFHQVGAFNGRIEENVGGIRVVQAFANEEHERWLFAIDNGQYRRTKLQAYRLMAASSSITYLGMRLTQLVVIVAFTWFVLHGQLSQAASCRSCCWWGCSCARWTRSTARWKPIPRASPGFRRYAELLAAAPDIVDAPDAVAASPLRGDIRFERVSFAYGGGRTVLHEIDLRVTAGETVAFVGPFRRGQDDAVLPCCRASTSRWRAASPSTAWMSER